MTLLNKSDQDEASYIDLAQFIREQGSPAHIARACMHLRSSICSIPHGTTIWRRPRPRTFGEVLAVIATWRARASKAHISVADIEEMGHLFITSQ